MSRKLGMIGKVVLSLGSCTLTWLAIEVGCRVIGFDFERTEQVLAQTPIFFQKPHLPLEPVFFRRAGPAEWHGQVLHEFISARRDYSNEYKDEPVKTIRYNAEGLRNPPELSDWEIAVVGDSFVEAGDLAFEDLFTTEIGKLLGVRVKNLGVSWTGPFSHSTFLTNFGTAPSAKHAVMVFFEGNDFLDLAREKDALNTFHKDGTRPVMLVDKQPSFTRAVWRHLKRLIKRNDPDIAWGDLALKSGSMPVTVDYSPPAPTSLSGADKKNLEEALKEWAARARELKMKPWLIYMPCKWRVLQPRLQYRPNQIKAPWTPNDLPGYVTKVAGECGIAVVDVTGPLTAKTKEGTLTYNPVFDSHLNREGSLTVARVVAEEFRRIDSSFSGKTNSVSAQKLTSRGDASPSLLTP